MLLIMDAISYTDYNRFYNSHLSVILVLLLRDGPCEVSRIEDVSVN